MYTNRSLVFIFLLLSGVWVLSEIIVQSRRPGRGTKRDRGSMLVSLGVGLFGVISSFLFPVFLPALNMTWQPGTFLIGSILFGIGVLLRWSAIWALGPYFTGQVVIQEDHRVVQHGPYKWIRHPSYTGALFLACGIGIMLANWASLGVSVIGLSIGLLYRIPVEEQALLQVPGYAAYMERTKRLIPFLF